MKESPPIKVVHVVLSLEPGGMENGVVNLANGLDRTEFDVQICCLSQVGAFAARLKQEKSIVCLNKGAGFSWKTVSQLRDYFATVKPDVIHTHNLGTLIYTELALRGSQKIPVLHGEHAEFSAGDLVWRRVVQRKILYGLATKIVPVSRSLGKHLIEHGAPERKVVPIDNGVDLSRFSPRDKVICKRAIGLPEDGWVIGMVGRFGAYKRHDMLIEAFEALADHYPETVLLLVGGGGPMEDKIKARVNDSPYRARIRLAGYQADPVPYYQAMDQLVVPSINEGMSNAVLEAMASSLPVLCHTACGHADLIVDGQNGYARDLADAKALADTMDILLKDRVRLRACGQAAREMVVREFSLQKMVENYAELYRSVGYRNGTK